jgi:hypothetical protein
MKATFYCVSERYIVYPLSLWRGGGGCLWWLIVSSSGTSCVHLILIDLYKGTEEQLSINVVQNTECVVCSDHF